MPLWVYICTLEFVREARRQLVVTRGVRDLHSAMVGKRHHQDTLPSTMMHLVPLRGYLRARIWNTGLVVIICPQNEL